MYWLCKYSDENDYENSANPDQTIANKVKYKQ